MAAPPFRVKALYDYVSQEEDDLKFVSNQIITVTDIEDDDWYYGEYERDSGSKQEGLFPKNFVKVLEPEAPPRPSRANRSKQEQDTATASKDPGSAKFDVESPLAPEASTATSEVDFSRAGSFHGPPQTSELSYGQPEELANSPSFVPEIPKPAFPTATKPTPPSGDKPSMNAFRDRINAFNKPAAAPVAPMRSGNLSGPGGSGFVKKPFVAPPPSKNAYFASPREPIPQKLYRKEEDTELTKASGASPEESKPGPTSEITTTQEEDLPKPTSLKDRIALLQKQQMEQAARHTEAAQKKEKSKRPKKAEELETRATEADEGDGAALDRTGSTETDEKRSAETNRRRRQSKEETTKGVEELGQTRDLLSDGNEADQSGGGDTEEGEEMSMGHDDSESKPVKKSSILIPAASQRLRENADLRAQASRSDNENDEEAMDEDVDPEVKRRMEIRERMAKMSGGMGMAGMFAPACALPSKTTIKKASASAERKSSLHTDPAAEGPASKAPPAPLMPIPGMQNLQSPEQPAPEAEVAEESEEQTRSAIEAMEPEDMPEVEDVTNKPAAPSRRSTDRALAPVMLQDRPVPPPNQERVPPPAPSGRPAHSPLTSRPVPPPPPRQLLAPSEGSESDDELSSHDRRAVGGDSSRPSSKEGPPQLSHFQRNFGGQPIQPAAAVKDFPLTPHTIDGQADGSPRPTPGFSTTTLPSAPDARAPPSPPSGAAPRRSGSSDVISPGNRHNRRRRESDEEITEYEGDYDTDIAAGAAHKDALKAHARAPSLEDESITGETPLSRSGIPSTGPPPSNAPRAVPPPPPPNQPPRKRQSSDMPRGAPPPPPPPKQKQADDVNEYDPYRYSPPVHGPASPQPEDGPYPRTPTIEEPENAFFSRPPPPHIARPSASQAPSHSPSSSAMPVPGNHDPRRSLEMHRTSATVRRSADTSRPSGEHYIATDVDLAQGSGWWAQPHRPPLVFQNRRDVIYEVDETSTIRRGGKNNITKEIYVLFMDYSQTQISVQFEASNPSTPTKLEQKHEPPPRNLRQDQLEEAHERFGARIAEGAKTKEGSTVGDGTSHALPYELISFIHDALRPVGVRAYGALVYANLANATVQQHDEIRPGDIITFRNAKFGGHRGPMKSKYSIEVGKPEHAGVVVDWDGSKKKVRAWEQGRESKKVKIESFKLGDMKSGEVKVWRVMSRSWVGWEGSN